MTKKAPAANDSTLKRDENGYGAAPGFEDFYLPEEELADGAVVDGKELAVRRLVDDTSTKAMGIGAAYLAGHRDVSAWQPAAPLGDDWNLVVVSEDDQGPYALFARPGVHGVLDGKAFAQEFLLGSLIKACTKHMKTLSKPWIDLKEGEQQRVLGQVQVDCRKAVQDAVDIIASNARLTFQASVDQVVFKDGVKCVLTLAKSAEAHSLADAEGSYVTIVIEERSKLLAEGNALDVEPDQKPMFDEAA